MQKITIKEIKVGKPGKPTIIIAEDDSRFSGFDTKLASLNAGAVIEVETEIKKGFVNISKWQLVSELTDTHRDMVLRRRPLNRMSLKKLNERNAEVLDRVKLCYRCGGEPRTGQRPVYISGQRYILVSVTCIGGICERCHKSHTLSPHEKLPRGRGGKLSLKNSIMVCGSCHRVAQIESYRKRRDNA